MNLREAEIAARKAMQWGDRGAIKDLVDAGYLTPIRGAISCDPGDCWNCDRKNEGLLVAIWWRVRYPKRLRP